MDYQNEAVKKLLEAQSLILEAAQTFQNYRDVLSEDKANKFDETEIEFNCYEVGNVIDNLCLRVFEYKTHD